MDWLLFVVPLDNDGNGDSDPPGEWGHFATASGTAALESLDPARMAARVFLCATGVGVGRVLQVAQ